LNRLQRNGTRPVVWIPPEGLRDLRELTRSRIVLVQQRTRLKNRLTATLAKYALGVEASDPYGKRARAELEQQLEQLPPQTRWVSQQALAQLDFVSQQIQQVEERLAELIERMPAMQRLETLPGVGVILAATIALEIGDVSRFPSAAHLTKKERAERLNVRRQNLRLRARVGKKLSSSSSSFFASAVVSALGDLSSRVLAMRK